MEISEKSTEKSTFRFFEEIEGMLEEVTMHDDSYNRKNPAVVKLIDVIKWWLSLNNVNVTTGIAEGTAMHPRLDLYLDGEYVDSGTAKEVLHYLGGMAVMVEYHKRKEAQDGK